MAAQLRRHALVAVALALTAAACGSDDAGVPGVGGAASTVPGETTSVPEATTVDGRPVTTLRSVTTEGRTTTTAKTAATNAALQRSARGGPGGFAGFLLAPGEASALVIDVLVQPGAEADPATITVVRDLLATYSGKSVTVRGPSKLAVADTVHSADEIRALAEDQGRAQGDGVAVVHLLYLGGAYTDESALGVAVRGDTVAVFPEQLDRVASPFVSRSRVERAVTTHEFGHVLGLVDAYLDTGRDDPDHPGHSTNTQSVMYWAVESDLVGQVLGGPPPIDFDARDQADLKKIRAGAEPG